MCDHFWVDRIASISHSYMISTHEEELMQKIQGEIDDFDAKIDKKVEKINPMKAQRKAENDKPLNP